MSITRTVSNGRDFSQAIKRAILGGGKFCVCCKRERATQVDHIHALQFGGSSDIDNATALCGRCHFDKTRAEAAADTAAHLLESGADINAENNQGVTPLHWAANRNSTNVVALLRNLRRTMLDPPDCWYFHGLRLDLPGRHLRVNKK